MASAYASLRTLVRSLLGGGGPRNVQFPPVDGSPAGIQGDLYVAGAVPSAAEQAPQHELHDPAVPVVVRLPWGVDAHDRVELLVVGGDLDRARGAAVVEDG